MVDLRRVTSNKTVRWLGLVEAVWLLVRVCSKPHGRRVHHRWVTSGAGFEGFKPSKLGVTSGSGIRSSYVCVRSEPGFTSGSGFTSS